MSTVAQTESNPEAYVDLKRAVVRLRERRWWLIAAVVLSTAAFAAYAFLSTPIYRATTILVPAGNEQGVLGASLGGSLGSLGGLASLAGINLSNSASDTEESLAVLRSREFTEAFINDKQLMPVLFEDAWDPVAKNWKNPAEPPTQARAFKYFDKGIRTISQDRRTGLVSMTIDWRDREQAAEWANELVERLNAEMRSRAVIKSDAAVKFLEEELKKTMLLGTQDAINRLIEAQIKQRMIANVTPEYAFRVVDRALMPDLTDKVRPKRLMLLILGPLVGLFMGTAAILTFGWLSDVLTALRKQEST